MYLRSIDTYVHAHSYEKWHTVFDIYLAKFIGPYQEEEKFYDFAANRKYFIHNMYIYVVLTGSWISIVSGTTTTKVSGTANKKISLLLQFPVNSMYYPICMYMTMYAHYPPLCLCYSAVV